MGKYILPGLISLFILNSSLFSQDNTDKEKNMLIPYVGVYYGGCDISVPFSFLAGVQQVKSTHISLAYDVHYSNTNYECYCDDKYSKGHFASITPSAKIIYSTGKKTSNGFFASVGLGYMIARDRGTEQAYTKDPGTGEITLDKEIVNGRWDFSSIAPSFSFGVTFRVLHFPVSASNVYYFANTTEGWGAVTGGIGLKIGFRKL